MTDKQPEALRLANEYYEDHWIVGTKTWCRETVEELRRLHQSEREGWRYANELDQERKRLHELNAELVGVMRTILNISLMDSGNWAKTIEQEVHAAISKATGEQS